MKYISLLTLSLSAARVVSGHAFIWGIAINGKDQGRGDAIPGYVRKIFDNNPVKDVKSQYMTCNNNKGPNSKTLDVKAGDKITVTWAHGKKGDDVIAPSHKGPVQVYIAPTESNGKGSVWVKIASDGYNEATKVWGTDKLRLRKGEHDFVVPAVKSGNYLFRPEIIALHEGTKIGGAQFYEGCVQVKVSGGSAELPKGIALPGAYSATDPGIKFNVYEKPKLKKYVAPGGPVIKIG